MDGYPFPSIAPTPSHSTTATPALHSTSANIDIRLSLRSLAQTTWDEHAIDLQQSHRWLEGFFDNLKHAAQSRKDGQRPAMSELMKTPGRKRLADTSNHSSNALTSTNPTMAKDPIATLLFPSAPGFPASSAHKGKGKENGTTGENDPPSPNPTRMLSPLAKAKSPFGSPLRSPMRTASPRPTAKIATPVVAPTKPAPVVEQSKHVEEEIAAEDDEEEEIAPAADLSNVMEEDEEVEEEEDVIEEEDLIDEEPAEPTRFSNASTVQEEQANLSIIGEEGEEEDDQPAPPVPSIPSPLPTPTPTTTTTTDSQTSVILPETQFTADASSPAPQQPTSPTDPLPTSTTHLAPTGSPRSRVVSGASSIADEADADTAVPLNDAPSLLRTNSNPLSSSVPASTGAPSTTRTPGGSVARYGAGSFSAAKLGVGAGLGSSPPMTAGKGMRTSTGGARQLNFVGLPKKSLGLGLGLGRSWGGANEGGSSQGSQTSQSQGSVSQASTAPTTQTSTAPSSVGASTTTTSTGATKRKSLSQEEGSNKSARVDVAAPQDANSIEEAASKAKRDALVSRMKNMQAGRQSAAAGFGGAGARMSGVNGQVAMMATSTNKPVSASSSSTNPIAAPQPQQQPIVAAATLSTSAVALPTPTPAPTPLESTFSTTSSSTVFPKLAPTPSLAEPAPVVAAQPSAPSTSLTRRPSVMDRVKSFEKSSTTDVRPPSPSKIPAATAYAAAKRPTSPAPGAAALKINPKSPKRLLSPSAVQREHPQPQPQGSRIASPSPARPPPSTSRIASPHSTRMPTRSSPAPIVQPKSPARPLAQRLVQQHQQQASTTPQGSPPPPSTARGILQLLDEAGSDEEEEEEESIRVVKQRAASVDARRRSWSLRRVGERWRARWMSLRLRLRRSSPALVRRLCPVLLGRQEVRRRKRMTMMRLRWLPSQRPNPPSTRRDLNPLSLLPNPPNRSRSREACSPPSSAKLASRRLNPRRSNRFNSPLLLLARSKPRRSAKLLSKRRGSKSALRRRWRRIG
ncbi:hypothetical protein BCR35DRAFT_12218 [Leucosporidium creatinivorum]|uniref:Inner centromere protein ARK-binding domain-containing protein n=1 Tax=Leucosporidium creatinivorum TaxID=106004 RepID=A0A1Y2G4S5_9BASI|nr:hypothetical protein BCR35DRAFT_12218 [Leucosporidium creatinivorum]